MATADLAGVGRDLDPALTLLITQLLRGQYNPTGLGTQAPKALGPSPARQPGDVTGAGGGGTGDMGSIWAAIAPYLALLGGGASNVPAGGAVNVANPAPALGDVAASFLQKILTQLISPAAAVPAAANVAPPAGAPLNPFANLVAAFGGSEDKGRGIDIGGGPSVGPGEGTTGSMTRGDFGDLSGFGIDTDRGGMVLR